MPREGRFNCISINQKTKERKKGHLEKGLGQTQNGKSEGTTFNPEKNEKGKRQEEEGQEAIWKVHYKEGGKKVGEGTRRDERDVAF